MSGPRIVILGASAAGLKAAARARRLLPGATITVVDRREFVSYGACGLPYVLSGEIASLDMLRSTTYGAIRDPEWFAATRDIEVMVGCEVLGIDRDTRAVSVRDCRDDGRTMLLYDHLVYALGGTPHVPAGIEPGGAVLGAGVPEDIGDLRRSLEQGEVEDVAVLGAGLMGLEMAGALADLWGCGVTVVEAADQVLPGLLDREMAAIVQAHLEHRGVAVRTGVTVAGAHDEDGRAMVELAGGEAVVVDRALVALGVRPNTGLARAAGLVVGQRGGLVVDANLRTSDPRVFAAGDCLELVHHVDGGVVRLPLGSLASRQGRVVGDNLAGRPSEFPAVVGSIALRALGMNAAATGLSEAAAAAAGLDVAVAWGSFDDRSPYHPDRERMFLKAVYETGCGRLIGLQAVGAGDVTKRVDVFAALLRQDARLEDLLDVEWCYAPPFNASLDPLHGLAAAALNACGGGLVQYPPQAGPPDRVVLDVRTAEEFAAADPPPLPGAVNVPLEELRARLGDVPAGDVLVVCAKGPRSVEAARVLMGSDGCAVEYLAGGLTLVAAAG